MEINIFMKKLLIIESDVHSEDLQEIITNPPSWLLQRGIMFILLTILIILGLSAFISYPEMVNNPVKFNTEDSPKIISSRIAGNLIKLLVKDGTWISKGESIAYVESTGDHDQILFLINRLQKFRENDDETYTLEEPISPKDINLGELQGSYQNFYLSYLNYLSSKDKGIYRSRQSVIQKEIINEHKKYNKNYESFQLQKEQLDIAEQEFEKYKLLAEKKVISPSELLQKEELLIAKRQTIPQMENSLISYESNILSKKKELTDVENQITEERKKFIQAQNSFISEAENWKKKYIITSPIDGKLIYGEFLQVNQPIVIGQKLFYVNPKNERYYAELLLPQNISAKVKSGQRALIKVQSYPHMEYGYINSTVSYISDIPIRDSVFFVKLELNRTPKDSLIRLKPGILGDAEIITEDKSILKRIWDNITKNLRF